MWAFRGSRYSWALFKDLWMPSPRCEILHRSSDIPGPRWELYGMGGVFSPSCGKLPGYLRTAFLGLCGRCWIEMQRAIFSSVFQQHESLGGFGYQMRTSRKYCELWFFFFKSTLTSFWNLCGDMCRDEALGFCIVVSDILIAAYLG